MLLISLALGVTRGLVYEVVSAAGWTAAFLCAQWFAPSIGAWLPVGEAGAPWRYAAAFVLVFIAVAFAAGLLAWSMRRMIVAAGLRPVDRTLGAAFGMLRGAVAVLAVAVAVHLMSLTDNALWRESHGAPWIDAALQRLKPMLPEKLASYLP
ncbi:MAG: colicin synthesis protein [Variovorax sp.]|nr:colicin synthesis protein [Variovorax sp.]